MKILLPFVLLIAFVVSGFSSPLIFKVKKEVITEDAELAVVDTLKYKQVRVMVQFENKDNIKKDDPTYTFNFTIFSIEDSEDLYFDGIYQSRAFFETSKGIYFNRNYDNPPQKLKFKAGVKGTYWLYVYGQ